MYLPDKMGAEYRLLVVSSRARNKVAIFNSVLPNLILVDYNYETTSLEELLEKITKALNGTKVASMAMVLHTSERELFICGPGPAFLSLKALINDARIKDFLQELGKSVLDMVSKRQLSRFCPNFSIPFLVLFSEQLECAIRFSGHLRCRELGWGVNRQGNHWCNWMSSGIK